MDVGGATRWTPDAVVSRREILARIEADTAAVLPLGRSSAPADRFVLPDGATFGIISSTTEPFCAACDRSRLTADGVWLLCLYAATGTDLRRPLRAGATREDLQRLVEAVWSVRSDRGAEERLGMDRQTTLIPLRHLKKDAHLEMHTRGGVENQSQSSSLHRTPNPSTDDVMPRSLTLPDHFFDRHQSAPSSFWCGRSASGSASTDRPAAGCPRHRQRRSRASQLAQRVLIRLDNSPLTAIDRTRACDSSRRPRRLVPIVEGRSW